MKKSFFLLFFIVAAVALIVIVHWSGVSLLPARQGAFTLLYTGDVEGYLEPCG
jgi:hypothetical protein